MGEVQSPGAATPQVDEPSPGLPDYVLSPNAVFGDEGVQWRYGKPPDYSKTRKVWAEGKKMNHETGSLPQLVENLVKNWEVEASFKPRLSDWRTVDQEKYSFAMAGGPGQSGEEMLRVGTYNAIIGPNEYYDPTNSDFASSHKTFKRMMPTFAWEVMEVYSGPPKVVFKWRHWGVMKNDYVGFNNKGQKVTAKAHGGPIEIFGTTIAQVNDKLQVESLDTYMDSLDMFRQIAPYGVVNNEPINRRVQLTEALDVTPDHDGVTIADEHNHTNGHRHAVEGHNLSNGNGTDTDKALHLNGNDKVSGAHLVNGHDAHAGDHKGPNGATDVAQSVRADNNGPLVSPDWNIEPLVSTRAACPFATTGLVDANQAHGLQPTHIQRANGMTSEDTPQHEPQAAVVPKSPTMPTPPPHAAPASAGVPTESAPNEPLIVKQQSEDVTATEAPGIAPEQTIPAAQPESPSKRPAEDPVRSVYSSAVTGDVEKVIKASKKEQNTDASVATGTYNDVDKLLEAPAEVVHPHPKDVEMAVQPEEGEAIVAPPNSDETKRTKEEMSKIGPNESENILNRE